MLNQYAVDIPTLPVNQCLSHLIQILVECSAVLWECRAAKMGRQAFGAHMVFRETFLQIERRLLQHLVRKSRILGVLMYQNTSPHVMSESQTPVQDQRCQSVNKLARSITKWTKACDKRLNRLISYIHHTCKYKQYCYVGNTAKQCRLGLFQDSDFAGDLEDSNSLSGGTL